MPRCIDVDKAYKVLTEYYNHKTAVQHEALKEALSRVPTVEADRIVKDYCRETHQTLVSDKYWLYDPRKDVRHGHWEQVEVVHDRKDAKIQEWQQAKCSVCGRWQTTPFMYFLKLDNYCPNCGAKMDGERREDAEIY